MLSPLLWRGAGGEAFAQQTMQDDPIAAALDSLSTQKILDKLYAKPSAQKNKYNYAPDSIPRFEDFVYENRLAKLMRHLPLICSLMPL